ncbi:MAG: hypothetical protein ACKVTZ_05195 [Bacteroidia bacterium]
MTRYLFLCFFLTSALFAAAQAPKDSLYERKEAMSIGASLTTRGGLIEGRWAFGMKKYQYLLVLDAALVKSMKEEKIRSWYAPQRIGSDYYFGKLNRVTMIAPTFGISRNIFPANHYNKINARADISAGPAFALLRPYFVNINTGGAVVEESELPNSAQYSYEQIVGEVSPFKKLSTRQTVIGLSIRTALQLNLTRMSSNITAVQVGLNLDAFAKPLPIMATEKNASVLLTACIGMTWGKRW